MMIIVNWLIHLVIWFDRGFPWMFCLGCRKYWSRCTVAWEHPRLILSTRFVLASLHCIVEATKLCDSACLSLSFCFCGCLCVPRENDCGCIAFISLCPWVSFPLSHCLLNVCGYVQLSVSVCCLGWVRVCLWVCSSNPDIHDDDYLPSLLADDAINSDPWCTGRLISMMWSHYCVHCESVCISCALLRACTLACKRTHFHLGLCVCVCVCVFGWLSDRPTVGLCCSAFGSLASGMYTNLLQHWRFEGCVLFANKCMSFLSVC